MAGLSFKIEANMQVIDELLKKLNLLEEGLKDMDASDIGFKKLEKQIEETKTQIKKYADEISRLKTAIDSVEASNSLIENARKTTQETNKVTDEFIRETGSLDELNRKIKELSREYNALSEVKRKGEKGTELAAEIGRLNAQRRVEQEYLRALQREYLNTQKVQDAQEGSIRALRAQLSLLTAQYDNLGRAMRSGAEGQELLKSIREVSEELSAAEQASGRFQRNVGNYQSGWNGLTNSVQQVARELPSLAVSMNTFFLAISNNIPLLADELAKARREYNAYKAAIKAGAKDVTPVASVWKQLGTAIFSWQSLLVAGVTILSLYGKEIIEWASSLVGVDKAQKKVNESLKEFNAELIKEKNNARLLFEALNKTKEGTEGRRKSINEINEVYGKYLPHLLSEKSSLDEINEAYKRVNKSIRENVAAKIQSQAIEELTKDTLEDQADNLYELGKQLKEIYRDYFTEKDVVEAQKKIQKSIQNSLIQGKNYTEATAIAFNELQERYGRIGKRNYASLYNHQTATFYKTLKQLSKDTYSYYHTIDEIQKKYNPFFDEDEMEEAAVKNKQYWEEIKNQADSYLNSLSNDVRGTLDKVWKIGNLKNGNIIPSIDPKIVESYKQAREQIEEANKALKVYSEEKGSLDKELKNREKINDFLLQVEFARRQEELNLIADANERKLQQIDLDYDKEIATIQKKQRELIAQSDSKTLSKEGQQLINAMYVNAWMKSNNAKEKVDKEEAERQKQALIAYNKEYGDYQQKRFAITEEYADKIAKAQTDGEIKSLTKERDKLLLKLEQSLLKETSLWARLFSDAEKHTSKYIRQVIKDTQQLLDYMNGIEGVEIPIGFTEEQIAALKEDPEKIKAILEELKNKRDELNTRNPFQNLIQGFKDLQAAGSDTEKQFAASQNIISGLQGISSVIGQVGDSLEQLGGKTGEVFKEMSSLINNTASMALTGLMLGGPIGAAIGGGLGLVTGLVGVFSGIKDKKKEKEIKRLQDQVDVLSRSYDRLGKAIDDAYSTDASKLISQQNTLLQQQKVLIQNQIKEEEAKKHTDDDRIKEWKEQLEDINDQIGENKKKMEDAIFGSDIQSAINDFAEAYVNAWAAGENKSLAVKDIVKNMIRAMITEMIKGDIGGAVEKIRDQIATAMFGMADSQGIRSGGDKIIDAVEKNAINKAIDNLVNQMDKDYGALDEWIVDKDKQNAQQSSKRGFETMTQDQAGELNGRFTALQMAGEEIKGQNVVQTQLMNTLSDKLNAIVVSNNSLINIADETRSFIVNSYMELTEISENTGVAAKSLKNIEKDIAVVKQNTSRL